MRTNETASELFRRLCDNDETADIEAKSLLGGSGTHTIMETVCSLSNEPGLGGGYLLLGVAENEDSDGDPYLLEGVLDPDKVQRDFSSQCASMFSIPIRPELSVETVRGKKVVVAFVPEVPPAHKPVRFKNEPLPGGAWRRIGSSDQHCTEEDLVEFFHPEDDFDASVVHGTGMKDVDETAVQRYRTLRGKINPAAEELSLDDHEMLVSLGCATPEPRSELTMAGVLLFGTAALQRRIVPGARVDYIRVPGTKWVETVDDTYHGVDMRGPLLTLLFRAVDAVVADLPRGFALGEDSLQAQSIGLPIRVLREALVNALMHRSYRIHQFTQIIRFDNRIEIRNAGHSLKPQDRFGQPGSVVRNPLIANVFHDTNLAETKGTGIRRMRNLMREAHLALPVFESDRVSDSFTAQLLLHHFLGQEDLEWLTLLPEGNWTDEQKTAMIFVRETGAIDNCAYRQISGLDTLRSSNELKRLRRCGLLRQKGKSTATYYIPGDAFPPKTLQGGAGTLQGGAGTLQGGAGARLECPENWRECSKTNRFQCDLFQQLPEGLQMEMRSLGKHVPEDRLNDLICRLCCISKWSRAELACFLGKNETYLRAKLRRLIKAGRLLYEFPEMPKHPNQTYKSATPHPTEWGASVQSDLPMPPKKG